MDPQQNLPFNGKYELDSFSSEHSLLPFYLFSPNLCFILSDEAEYVNVNPAFKTMLGFESKDLFGLSFYTFMHPEDVDQVKIQLKSLQADGNRVNFEARYRDVKNTYHWINWSGFYQKEQGLSYLFGGNITAKKVMELDLRHNRNKYLGIFRDNPNPMWIYDLDTLQFLEVNQAAINLYGYTEEEFLALTLKDIRPNDTVDQLLKNLASVTTEFIAEKEIWKHLTKAGETLFVELSAKTVAFEGKNARSVIINDVTQKIKAEKALLESEAKYRILTETTPDLIMRFDRNHKHLFANAATRHFFGMEPETFIGKTHQELGFSKEGYSHWHAKMDEVFASGIPIKEVVYVEEAKMYVDWNLVPEFNAMGEVESVLSFSRDITEIIQNQLKMKENEQLLQLLNDEKDKFFSIIAHDLRSPFTSILGRTFLLSQDLQFYTPEKIKVLAGDIHKSATHYMSLLENLLEWAKVKRGLTDIHIQEIDLTQKIGFVLETLSELLSQKELTLKNTISGDVKVMADENMLSSIFRNIISNAIKFTPRGGLIELAIQRMGEAEIEISISDNGTGMDEKTLQALFSISTHLHKEGTEREKGTGLGLLLVYEFVGKLNGRIEVNSRINEGTQFILCLPLAIK